MTAKTTAKTSAAPKDASDPSERRRSRRRPVLDTFSLFLVVPKKGAHRLPIHDISREGIGFSLDTEGETPETFPLESGEVLQLRLYLNQTLYLPLTVRIARIENQAGIRRVGAELDDQHSPGYQAFASFNQMLDDIVDTAHLDPSML